MVEYWELEELSVLVEACRLRMRKVRAASSKFDNYILWQGYVTSLFTQFTIIIADYRSWWVTYEWRNYGSAVHLLSAAWPDHKSTSIGLDWRILRVVDLKLSGSISTKDLVTVEGEKLTVEFPGWFNRGVGPDFLEARVRIENIHLLILPHHKVTFSVICTRFR